MSERRRIFSSTRLNEKERTFGKENICDLRQSNKLAGTNSQKTLSLKKSYPSDIGGPCYCNVNACNDIINNNVKSSTKKTPFRIHFDRAGNDLNKGVRVRERIIEYDTRRIEELKRNTRFSENKLMLLSRRGSYTNKQQPEVNLAQDLQSFKENRELVPNSFVSSCNKASVKSDKTIFDLKLPKPQISITKSLVDLSHENKQSTFVNNVRDVSKQDFCPRKSTYVEKKELVVTTSHLRSRSCSNQRTVVVTRSRIASTGSTNEAFVDLQKQQSGSNKCKAFDGNKDSLFGGFSTILSSDTLKNQAISKGSNKSDSLDILIRRGKRLYDQERQPLVDTIPSKVRGKVKNDWEVVKQNTDFSPYLLYHSDYLVDLLTIEKEKEDNSLKLSSGFINKYANNEPRNIIVAFLIHLATHCRYPSFILYQAVKLFDIILDKIPIDITDMQIVAITALWIVLKKDGNFNNIPSATVMLALIPDQQYTNVDILAEWERVVLRSLKFNISFSDPFSIFVFYVINCDYDQDKISNRTITKIYYCGGYIIDLTLLDVSFSCITSNHLALAVAELVMCIVLDNDLSSPRWHFWRSIITDGINIPIRIYDDEINVLRSTMISHVLESEKKHTKEETVKKRYSHNRYGNISNFLLEKIKKIPPENYSISM